MSLGRLLAAGKSLMGGRNGGGRYREDKRVRLPKFISPKNPFGSAEKVAPVQVSAPEIAMASVMKPATVAQTRSAGRQVSEPGAAKKLADKAVRAPARVGARAARLLSEWSGKLNPLPLLAKRPANAKAVRSTQLPVQGELSLERVKVVRNDFSDSDFEVVPARVASSAQLPKPVAAVAEQLEPVGAAWSRLTTKFFGAGEP